MTLPPLFKSIFGCCVYFQFFAAVATPTQSYQVAELVVVAIPMRFSVVDTEAASASTKGALVAVTFHCLSPHFLPVPNVRSGGTASPEWTIRASIRPGFANAIARLAAACAVNSRILNKELSAHNAITLLSSRPSPSVSVVAGHRAEDGRRRAVSMYPKVFAAVTARLHNASAWASVGSLSTLVPRSLAPLGNGFAIHRAELPPRVYRVKQSAAFLACKSHGGIIPIEPKYFEIARKRIEAELNRAPLFEAAPKIQQSLI